MKGFFTTALTIFGLIIVLAIISVVISRKSQAPQAIQAISTGMANIVAAAVNPSTSAATNANPGANSFAGRSMLDNLVQGLGGGYGA